MLYGYAMAVIAGFLLTAVCNWTGQPALQGTGLMLPFLLWLAARLASMLDLAVSPWLMLVCDLGFWILLSVAVMKPILKVRQWRQSGILAKLLLLVSQTSPFMRESWVGLTTAFVGGSTEAVSHHRTGIDHGPPGDSIFYRTRSGLFGGTEKLELARPLRHRHLPFLFAWELLFPGSDYSAHFALALFAIHAIRISGWLTPESGKTSALEPVCRLFFYDLGFSAPCRKRYFGWNPFLAVHAFAMGGIGLISLSMMARVSLGHSGRSIHEPPSNLTYALALLICGIIFRVFFPLLWPEEYLTWIALARCFGF